MYSKEYNEYTIITRITTQHKLHLRSITLLHEAEQTIHKDNPLWQGYTHNTFPQYYKQAKKLLTTLYYDNALPKITQHIKQKEGIK